MNAKKYPIERRPFLELSEGGVLVREATELGFSECVSYGVFDAAYTSSVFRRSRVKEQGHICGALTVVNPAFYVFIDYG